MHDSAFGTVIRRAAAMSRRGSLRRLGGVGLAGVFAASTDAGAGKVRKNAGRRCKKSAALCRTGVENNCDGDPVCLETHLPCCEHFAQ